MCVTPPPPVIWPESQPPPPPQQGHHPASGGRWSSRSLPFIRGPVTFQVGVGIRCLSGKGLVMRADLIFLIELQLTSHKTAHFEVNNSVAFSAFEMWCSHDDYLVRKGFCHA